MSNSEAKNKQVSQLYYMIFVIRTFGNLQIYLVWGMLQLQGLVSEVLSGSQYLHFLQHCDLFICKTVIYTQKVDTCKNGDCVLI